MGIYLLQVAAFYNLLWFLCWVPNVWRTAVMQWAKRCKSSRNLDGRRVQGILGIYSGHILTVRYLAYANYICLVFRLHIRALLINKYCCVADASFGVNDL